MSSGDFKLIQVGTNGIDVRILAATNKNLEEAMEKGTFRNDLYYRLNVIPIYVPALRERRDDVQYLVYHFIEKFNKIYGKNISDIEPKAMSILKSYEYPGNIRELENLIERLVVLHKSDTNIIEVKDLAGILPSSNQSNHEVNMEDGLVKAVEDFEKNLIVRALEENGNNKVQTAKVLRVNRSTFMSKIKKYNIN